MTTAALALSRDAANVSSGPRWMFARVAWRNLWRRRLRTWLSAGGIAFAVFLVSFFVALQAGTYGGWIEAATGLMTSHLQLQHPDYQDDPKVANALPRGTELTRLVEAVPGVTGAAPRAEAFALISAGERSYGGLVMGVDAEREAALFTLPHDIREGEYLPRSDSAFVGAALATNLGLQLGDEIVVLGAAKGGGVAALALAVDGIFETGAPDLDRSVMQARLAAVQGAFELGDSVHRVAVKTTGAFRVAEYAADIGAQLPAGVRLVDWNTLLPELQQAIELDRVIAGAMYWLLMVLVAASVINAFIMTAFERTREFGMLLAIGMRPNAIVGVLTIEAICVWAIGAALGIALCTAVVLPLSQVGIDLASFDENIQDLAARMKLPSHMYPALSPAALVQAPLVMLLGTLVAAWIPALRVRGMRPVDALREEE